MPRPRLASKKSVRIAAAAAGGALVSLPVIGAVSNRLRGDDAAAAELLADPELLAEAERTGEAIQQKQGAVSQFGGIDAGSTAWSLDGIADLVGMTATLGGKVISAGVDGAGEVASLAGKGAHGLIEVAGAVGGALPDLGDIAGAAGAVGEVAGAIGGAAGDILGAIGDGLGDLNF
jgi:hypothetical protein